VAANCWDKQLAKGQSGSNLFTNTQKGYDTKRYVDGTKWYEGTHSVAKFQRHNNNCSISLEVLEFLEAKSTHLQTP
jgi:hypothetical protein